MFQYGIANDAFDVKIKNDMNFIEKQCASHARILKRH